MTVERFPDLHPALDPQSAVAEANRCLFCFDAPCTAACPTHIDVPRFIKKISTGNVRGSALTILDANILGLSCSRVCPVEVLCEGSCVMHGYGRKPIQIGLLQRHAMEHFYANSGRASRAWTGQEAYPTGTIACIGGGPASLACAAELRRHGFAVSIFDNRPLPGGLNTYGVAQYKLRPSDAQHEVEFIRSLGVEFQQADVGRDVPLETLEKQFDYIFIGAGLGAAKKLGIPGEDLPHVVDALRFIERYKTHPELEVRGIVAVIGGGNTAIDAANAAARLGAAEVHVFYRRTQQEMSAFPFEYEHSKTEGVHFHWRAQPVAFTPEGIDFGGMHFPCDLAITALGQSRLTDRLPVETSNGCITIDRSTGQTSNPKYYAGGDCANGGREVVDAVADGKRAALAIVERARRG